MLFNYYPNAYQSRSTSSQQYPVAVTANFAADGRFLPIYLQYEDEDCSRYTFKVDGIKFTRDKRDYILFCCLITNQGIQQQILLSYYLNECRWVLAQ